MDTMCVNVQECCDKEKESCEFMIAIACTESDKNLKNNKENIYKFQLIKQKRSNYKKNLVLHKQKKNEKHIFEYLSFLFHLVVYENHWEQKPLTRILLGLILVAAPFLIIIT